MPNMSPNKVKMPEQDPNVRNKNFEEVSLGYTKEQAMEEATRCLNCKKPFCMDGCPVGVPIPEFIHHVAEGEFEEADKNRRNRLYGMAECKKIQREISAYGDLAVSRRGNAARICGHYRRR